MHKRPLGNTDIQVTELCLGTMTWGQQNTQQEAFEQLDYAIDYGVNFIDTAEMYAVPARAETYGATETIIGNWLAKRCNRDKIVLASKICGPGDWLPHIRGGQTHFNQAHINQALEGSLKRLKTDYIDLYQLHWPDRHTNFFGPLGYKHNPNESMTPIEETLEALDKAVASGKVRHIGLSNETPWGTMRFLQLAEQRGWPRTVSIQNPYSLLNRSFEVGLAEISHRENVGLLAYSPLAFGMLSGKYLNNQWPEGARLTLFKQFSRYTNPQAMKATERYLEVARKHQLDLSQMAIAYVTSRPFVTSNIIGATSMAQLKSNLSSSELVLSKELLKELEATHKEYVYPAP
ncbi:MAG: NADP(H)-dependent aldo-keto reductase [Gammaproteobacteria bacterium]|nr:MAG: NADP(H)-dependent aldo-keto reductase [Gammaproteobacteria bacterium]